MTDTATDITITTLLLAWERSYVESLNAILAGTAVPGRDNDDDVNRWRGHAEAYRQVCERVRREFGMQPARYTSAEWRHAHGVYTDADIASFRRVAGGDAA
jgi:hypothetical protein